VSQRLDRGGNVLSTDLYDAFGNRTGTAPASDPWGFGAQWGYQSDNETGLVLCTNRYYDPQQGRFLTRDPIGQEGGVDLYSYTANNPVNEVDPDGTQTPVAPPAPPIPPMPGGGFWPGVGRGLVGVGRGLVGVGKWGLTGPVGMGAILFFGSGTPRGPLRYQRGNEFEPGHYQSPATQAPWEQCPSGAKKYKVVVRCAVHPVKVGPGAFFVEGEGEGSTEAEASANAQKDANSKVPPGFQKKHCHTISVTK